MKRWLENILRVVFENAMRLGIDASNIRGGGGYTILAELLKCYKLNDFGINEIKIWANSEISKKIFQSNTSLNVINVKELDYDFVTRFRWRQFKFPEIARQSVDLLLIPGGMPIVKGIKNVSMSLNLLPFMPDEYKRDGSFVQNLKYIILRRLNYDSLTQSNGAIFLNENARDVIYKEKKIDQPYAICPLGVDERFFLDNRDIKPNKDYSFETPFKFIYVSTVNSYKHQWVVTSAVKRARDDGYPVTIDFIGGGYSASLKRLEKSIEDAGGDKSGSKYLGKVPFETLHTYYHQADGFIFASSCENMPNIGIEAMAAALPMASSNLEPMKSLFKNCSLFFDPENAETITWAIKQIFDDAGLRKKISNAAYSNAQSYSWKNFYETSFKFMRKIYLQP